MDQQITVMVSNCSGLVIVTYIIIKFIASHHHQPHECLDLIIRSLHITIYEGKSGIDKMYCQIFLQSFKDIDIDDMDFFDLLQLVVGSIVLALNPLTIVSLAKVLNIHIMCGL